MEGLAYVAPLPYICLIPLAFWNACLSTQEIYSIKKHNSFEEKPLSLSFSESGGIIFSLHTT